MDDRTSPHFPTNHRATLVVRLLAPIMWALAILWLSLTASPPEIPGIFGWDKLLHAGAYGLLALLVAQFLILYFQKYLYITGMICIMYGILVEVLQLIGNAGRMFEWLDILADGVGIVFVCVVFRHVHSVALKYANSKGRADG